MAVEQQVRVKVKVKKQEQRQASFIRCGLHMDTTSHSLAGGWSLERRAQTHGC